MGFSCTTRNVFFILPLLILLSTSPLSSSFTFPLSSSSLSPSETSPLPSSLSPSEKVTKELLYNLCSKPSIYNHFCISWLTSDPTTYTLNVNGLLGLVLQKTQLLGYNNLAMMKGLVRTTTEKELRYRYGSCVTDYELSIKAIEGAIAYAFSKEYLLAGQAASKAFDNIYDCEGDLEGMKNVPDYVSRSNLMYDRMCTIGKVFFSALTA